MEGRVGLTTHRHRHSYRWMRFCSSCYPTPEGGVVLVVSNGSLAVFGGGIQTDVTETSGTNFQTADMGVSYWFFLSITFLFLQTNSFIMIFSLTPSTNFVPGRAFLPPLALV